MDMKDGDWWLFDHQSNPRLRRVLWNPWQKMFGQGVQTPSEGGGKWVFFIRTTYPDRICYRPECDRHECRVLLLEGVQIGERAAIPPGMYHIRNSATPPFHPDVSHPESSPLTFHPEICSAAIPS
uniref:Uncharacterized protein n=1 Tax=Vitis vinifera TaxID=29760 RepID=A5BX45_VITVI|nr:hypothetical protein VITISV_005695 [Vitis vinifera]